MIEHLDPDALPEVVDVLCEAFHDYPVMRYVLGESKDYDADLRTMIGFFAECRALRDEVMLGERADGVLGSVALVAYPGRRENPPALGELRERTWALLGDATHARYQAFTAALATIPVPRAHVDLRMIGVRDAWRGRGRARPMIEAVHALSASDRESEGVSLSTEEPRNVTLYEHFGYDVIGEADVAGAFTTWVFFRPDGV